METMTSLRSLLKRTPTIIGCQERVYMLQSLWIRRAYSRGQVRSQFTTGLGGSGGEGGDKDKFRPRRAGGGRGPRKCGREETTLASGNGGDLTEGSGYRLVGVKNQLNHVRPIRLNFMERGWIGSKEVFASGDGNSSRRGFVLDATKVKILESKTVTKMANAFVNLGRRRHLSLMKLKQKKDKLYEALITPAKRENIWTIPNALCIMRIGMAPVIAYMIVHNQFGPAVGVFAVAGVTDLLDGWIARMIPGQSTVMGSFLDPMADKILVGTLFLSLTYMDLIPVALTGLIIGRDAILIAFGFYIRYQSLDPPRTLTRYFNVTYPTAQLAPTFISKINTGVQLGLAGTTLLSTVIPYELHPFLEFLWYFTAATTVTSAISYCFAKDTVKLLRKPPPKVK